MGACFGIFKKRSKPNRLLSLRRCVYVQDQDKVELELLVEEGMDDFMDDNSTDGDVWTMSKGSSDNIMDKLFAYVDRELALLSTGKIKSKPFRVDRGVTRSAKSRNSCGPMEQVSENQQLLALDAYSLLASRAVQERTTSCCSSTPPSSLDLEWENENCLQTATSRQKSQPSSNVDDGGSSYSGGGGGSPESLEWDPCDPNVTDFETEQLINEIELLTRRALQETGDWTDRGS